MKKIFALFIVAVLGFTVMSCNQAKKDADNDQAILDSIAKVEAEQIKMDSLAAIETTLQAEKDSLEAALKLAEEAAMKAKKTVTKKKTAVEKKIEAGDNVTGKKGRRG